MKPWLKAGLIGAAVVLVFELMGLIPGLSCVVRILELVAYFVVGILAASWIPPVRQAGSAAGQGALAGLLSSLAGGITLMISATVQLASTNAAEIISQLPADAVQQLQDAGIDPAIFVGPGAGLAYGGACCGSSVVIGVLLAAVGAALFAALKPNGDAV